MDEGGEHLVVSRELIVADDLEVFAFIEAVVYQPTFPDAGHHLPLRLVEQVSVGGSWVFLERQIRTPSTFLPEVRVIAGLDVDHFLDALQSFIVKSLHCLMVHCDASMKKCGRSVRRPTA